MIKSSQCFECKNYISNKIKNGKAVYKCKAFDIIPIKILLNNFIHTKKYKGQKNDILFESIKPKKQYIFTLLQEWWIKQLYLYYRIKIKWRSG